MYLDLRQSLVVLFFIDLAFRFKTTVLVLFKPGSLLTMHISFVVSLNLAFYLPIILEASKQVH